MRWLQSLLIASAAWGVSGPVLAQQTDATFRPQQMAADEWSLQKAGQVQEPAAVDDPSAEIAPPDSFDVAAKEKRVEVPPPPPVPVSHGVPAEVLALDTNMPTRVTDLLACRMEIATDRRVRLQQVAAGSVLLRWTVDPGGGVSGAETVAQRRTDPDVLSCVRRKMESWVFIRAPGGEPLAIQQTLKFD